MESQIVMPSTPVDDGPSYGLDFRSLGLGDQVLAGLGSAGFSEPTEIQAAGIPTVLSGHDMIGQARTGSGKTGAYVLPALDRLKFDKTVEVLVLVPTRELARQVVGEVVRLGKALRPRVVGVVGGEPSFRQVDEINSGAQIVVATPGRLLDHLRSGRLRRFTPGLVVLDEADEMLDMGFIEDIRTILGFLPEDRQTLLFSATMPEPIARLAKEHLKSPKHVRLSGGSPDHQDIEQCLYVMKDHDRVDALIRLMELEDPEKAIIFCRTRRDVDELNERLTARGLRAKALHGDMRQEARMQAVKEIRKGKIQALIATDVASRGLDISDLTHVINFQAPENKDRYVHRIGRTGRAGNKGKAITFASPGELRAQAFFRSYPSHKFSVESLPTRTEVQKSLSRRMAHKIEKTEISPDAVRLCEDLVKNEDAFDLLCRFVTHMQASRKVHGPDKLGFSAEEVKRLSRSGPRGRFHRGGPRKFRR